MAKDVNPQDYLVKAKLYRFVSLLFVTIGVVLFSIMYIQNVEGHLLEALKDPRTIFMFLVPFLPAAILSMLADRAEKKYKDARARENTSPK